MVEFFWFLLGVVVCQLFSKFLNLRDKALFLRDIKFLAFQLIGTALKDLLAVRKTKYIFLKNNGADKEKMKIHYNEDEAFLKEWKKKVIFNLNSAVPPIYREVLDVKTWDDILNNLDIYYKRMVDNQIDYKSVIEDDSQD